MPEAVHTLLLGGWGFPRQTLEPLASALESRGDRVTLLTPDEIFLDPAQSTEDSIESLLEKGPPPQRILGWSLGALLALSLLPRIPGVPALLLAPCARFTRAPDHPAGIPRAELRALRRSYQRTPVDAHRAFLQRCAAPCDAPLWAPTAPPGQALHASRQRGLDALDTLDLRPRLSRISNPVHILVASEDAVLPPALSSDVADRLPAASLDLLPSTGHDAFLRQPGLVVRAMHHLSQAGL